MDYFPGFKKETKRINDTEIMCLHAGEGEPLLLLHGFPQSHLCWWKVAPQLSKHFHVIVMDLRGYGESGLPHLSQEDRSENLYTKRHNARDVVQLMAEFSYEQFYIAGHDRGARVAHRLCLDYPDKVKKVALLDIIPSLAMAEKLSQPLAMAYFHQPLLAQPYPFPETLFAGKETFFIRAGLASFSAAGTFPEDVLEHYIEKMAQPERFFAMCEDYRAAASIDLEQDRESRSQGKKLSQDVLLIWGGEGKLAEVVDVEAAWESYLERPALVKSQALPCGHFIPEEKPEECVDALLEFFGDH